MNITQIENNLHQLVKTFNEDTFIYDMLLAYGTPKASIKRLQQGGLNLSKVEGEIAWKKKLFFKSVQKEDVHVTIDEIKRDEKRTKHDPRFIIITDFLTLLAIDRKTLDTLDIPILEIAKHFDFFLPLIGMEKAQHQNENPADVKAAERMAKLYDELRKDNQTNTTEEIHSLNVFLSRLLFCFFAEDTGIFEKGLFTDGISSHTQQDGSDLNSYLDKLFEVMNTEPAKRNSLPAYLEAFPFVNGGLFKKNHLVPIFTKKSRQATINNGDLDWSAINPDIFGSIMQSVVSNAQRSGFGMHYTSVPNIMKVIGPLFLNDLYQEFELAKGNPKKLNSLLQRISKIKIFDPACGSGNFLIIAYKELRRLEMKIFKELGSLSFSYINLENFYGIELDDFAHEVAILSLWLAEHQMNQEFFKEFGRTKPALPLKKTGNIVHGNATRIDWDKVCPKKKDEEIYILGNPPYLGYALQSQEQKADMLIVFRRVEEYKKLDYIACWFYLGGNYIRNSNSKFAFVSTNSICQGEQVAILWPNIFEGVLEIGFAHQSFKWKNNAKANAGVTVVIIGIQNHSISEKKIYTSNKYSIVKEINAYLVASSNIIVHSRNKPLSDLPEMIKGSSPGDGGNLTLSETEVEILLKQNPEANIFIKKYLGADEFLYNKLRYCIWVDKKDVDLAYSIIPLKNRFEMCRQFRIKSKKEATRKKSETPYDFDEKKYKASNSIIIPQTTSELREYIPIGFLNSDIVISNAARVIYNAEPWLFSILTSKFHKVWIDAVAGRLETRIQYSNTLCYNTFPFPFVNETQKQELKSNVLTVLEERENHSEKTLAQLYNPDKMPEGLRNAHYQLDLAVERCYRSKPFESDKERLEYLFKLYEQMISEEKERNGELNFDQPKTKKKKK